MGLNSIKEVVVRGFHTSVKKIKDKSPELLLAGGIVLGAGAIVLACKETLAVEDILDEHETRMAKIHADEEAVKTQEKDLGITYAEDMQKDIQKRTAVVYVNTAWNMAKHYAPSVALFGLSVTCLIFSHNIMQKKYLAAVAAYQAADLALKNYRANVIEQYGEDADYALTHKEIDIVNEDGSVETKKYDVSYCFKYFEKGSSTEWQPTMDPANNYNLHFLYSVQSQATAVLKLQGFLTLNEVYAMLGMTDEYGCTLRTAIGDHVGWIYTPFSKDEADKYRDNQVVFNLDKDQEFVHGKKDWVLLEFNVDGWITDDLIKKGLMKEW